MRFFTLIGVTILSPALFGALVSTNAGRVGERVLTSREVLIGHIVEQVSVSGANIKIQLKPENVKAREFIRETTAALLETAIFLEAESFGASPVAPSEVEREIQDIIGKVKKVAVWKTLEVQPHELRDLVTRKLRAKSFINFKMASAVIPISDQEAEDYFNANRLKFENLPFESFKDNIKKYLTKQQSDKRLKDWFELLQSKYQVRNYLAE